MSVKKAESTAKKPNTKKEEVKEDEVKVETASNVEVTTEEPKEDEVVEVNNEEANGVGLEVDETPVDNSNQAKEKNVRIKLRCDHKCWFAGVCYEFKQGACYNVPNELKMRLSKADILLPL